MLTRRILLLLPLAIRLRAAAADDAWALLRKAASALSAGDASAFLACFDPAMPGYSELKDQVSALLLEWQVGSTIEPESNEGDDRVRTVKLDWLLLLVLRQDGVTGQQREKVVSCRLEKQPKGWRIVQFEPSNFFSP